VPPTRDGRRTEAASPRRRSGECCRRVTPAGPEVLARVRGLGQATFRLEVTGGSAVPIHGDGRTSWAAEPDVLR
jgi:hypothetical protein